VGKLSHLHILLSYLCESKKIPFLSLKNYKMSEFEAVIGLEIHIQLQTKSKAFSSDSTEYGALPNTQVSPISLGHPGTLPVHNQSAVEMAIKMGLALDCDIRRVNQYSRKNYFYADLPKGYQITQFDTPLCNNGHVTIKLKDGIEKNIRLTRIHMEEGSMRCDANISVMPKGTTVFGTKVEVKNMNSISNVKRAIDFEIQRQIEVIENGGKVDGETRGFNGLAGTTFSMRKKEAINDYRYFPEPDLPPTIVTEDYIAKVKSEMPELPRALFARFTNDYGLSDYDAAVLIDDKLSAFYFEDLCKQTSNYKAASNWITVAIRGYLNENALDLSDFQLKPNQIAEVIQLIDSGVINHSIASQKLFPTLLTSPEKTAKQIVEELNLATNSDTSFIEGIIDEVLALFPEKVAEYKSGKTGLLGMFVGEVMKRSKGKADPKITNQIISEKLDA
jgi:Asp-tRNA(Asn)/Glu-tRNA(Gln) amidotransferase B subunit